MQKVLLYYKFSNTWKIINYVNEKKYTNYRAQLSNLVIKWTVPGTVKIRECNDVLLV